MASTAAHNADSMNAGSQMAGRSMTGHSANVRNTAHGISSVPGSRMASTAALTLVP